MFYLEGLVIQYYLIKKINEFINLFKSIVFTLHKWSGGCFYKSDLFYSVVVIKVYKV